MSASQPILVLNVPAHGHINPTLPVVAELASRGHRLIYYGTEDFCAKIEEAGVEFRAYPATGLTTSDFARRAGSLPDVTLLILEQSLQLLPFVLGEIDRENPSVLVFDSIALWGMQAARLRHLPSVSSISTLIHEGVPDAMTARDVLHILRDALPVLLGIARRRRGLVARFGPEVFPRKSIAPASVIRTLSTLHVPFSPIRLSSMTLSASSVRRFVRPHIAVRTTRTG